MDEVEANKALVAEFFAAMSRGDIESLLDAYAEDGYVQTMGNTLISGKYSKDQIRTFADGIYEAFPKGLTFTVRGITAEGERVAVEAESQGDHISGRSYNNFYHFLFTIRDGKIAHLHEYLDTELATEVLCGGRRP